MFEEKDGKKKEMERKAPDTKKTTTAEEDDDTQTKKRETKRMAGNAQKFLVCPLGRLLFLWRSNPFFSRLVLATKVKGIQGLFLPDLQTFFVS